MTLRVNGVEIGEQAIAFELQRLITFFSRYMPADKIREQMDDLRVRAREQAVGAQLLLREAHKRMKTAPKAEVDAELEKLTREAGGKEAFDKLLAKQQLTMEQVTASVESGKKLDALVREITAGVTDPTEEEIRAHYDATSDNYVKPARARAQHILAKPASTSEKDRKEARDKLEALRAKHQAGRSFAELAAAYSDCPSGRRAGGSLGWISRGTMLPRFEEALFSQELNKVSEVVETPLGYHIVLTTDREAPSPASFEEVKTVIHDLLIHDRRGKAISAFVDQLKAVAKIEDDGK